MIRSEQARDEWFMDSSSIRDGGVEAEAAEGAARGMAGPPEPSRSLLKRLAFSALAAFCLLGCGFWAFADSVERAEAVLPASADGIVVLTGGPDRIVEGVELLARGLGKRLLITGVGPGVSLEKIGKPMPQYKHLLECCVDIEYTAQNTVGNAVAARGWASRNGYHALIVVTSNYHLPRALIEFRRAMPAATLYSHPVSSERLAGDRWWRDGSVARLMVLEYGKFLVAWCRLHVVGALSVRAA